MSTQPRKLLGWPVKDLVVFTVAFITAVGVMSVYSPKPIAWLAGGCMGLLWFFLGVLYGYQP